MKTKRIFEFLTKARPGSNGAVAVSATVLLLCASHFACAADLSGYKADSDAIIFQPSWAGLYVGGQAGGLIGADNGLSFREVGIAGAGGSGGSHGDDEEGAPGKGGNGGDAHSVRGMDKIPDGLIGWHLGYNWQASQFVYGVETDLDLVGGLDNLMGSVRGRIGVGSERTLFYATAGLAYLSIDGRHSLAVAQGAGGGGGAGGAGDGAPGKAGSPAQPGGVYYLDRPGVSEVGFVAGGGLEYKLSQQVGLGVEGLYYAFDKGGLGQSFDSDVFSVRGRLTFHLDKGGEGSYKDAIPGVAIADWAGFYVGGHAGAAYDAASNTINSVYGRNGDSGSAGTDGTGGSGGGGGGGGGGAIAAASLDNSASFSGGGQIGYNWQNGAWVYGVEGDLTFSDSAQHHLLATGRGRLGYATGAFLFYGTGGVAYANAERYRAIVAGDGANGQKGGDGTGLGGIAPGGAEGAGGHAYALKTNEDKVGYVVGGGIDAKVTDHVTLGFEGLYYGFDVKTGSGAFPANAATFAGADGSDEFVVRSRISYQFSPSHEALK